MDERKPEEVRLDVGGWISGPSVGPPTGQDAVDLEELQHDFGRHWVIFITSRGTWEAFPRPNLEDVLTGQHADALRAKLEDEEARRRPPNP